MSTNEMIMYDQLIDMEVATPEEINLVRCCMNGTWTDVLTTILYIRTGYRSIEQMFDDEEEE